MNTLLWVLAGVLAYSAAATALQVRGYLPSAIRVQGPLTTIHTTRGRAFLSWLSAPRRFWRAWSNVGVGITLVVMAGMFLFLVQGALGTLTNPAATVTDDPTDFLIVPGVNQFLPLAVAPEIVAGLAIALVVHEGGHGLLCRVGDIDIDSLGMVFFTIVPVGAFVEPEETSQAAADRGTRTRMFAAGVTNNFAVTVIAFALLFGPVIGAVTVAPGVAVGAVFPGTPAADAGIGGGDRITGVDGQPVANTTELETALDATNDTRITVEVNGEQTVTVDRRVVVLDRNPAVGNFTTDPGESALRIDAVDGTPVQTETAFERAARNTTVATLDTTDGQQTLPLGALFPRVGPDDPLANASGDLANRSVIVTHVEGERVIDRESVNETLADRSAGDSVTVRAYVDGEPRNVTVTLTDAGVGGLGTAVRGTSGLVVDDLGVRNYPAGLYLTLLGGGDGEIPLSGPLDSALGLVYVALLLPLAGAVGVLPFNFAGFYGQVANFYDVTGPLGAAGEWPVFLLANVLFWTGWINIQLGVFNCIPGYPLDGGRILRMGVESVVSRLPVPNRPRVVRTITTSVGLIMLAALLVIVFAPQVL